MENSVDHGQNNIAEEADLLEYKGLLLLLVEHTALVLALKQLAFEFERRPFEGAVVLILLCTGLHYKLK